MENKDSIYMLRALDLARNGIQGVRTNPMVGCVIVADNRIIGEGYHRRYGEGHAEVNAVASVNEADCPLLSRATAYVTLEPCSHYGKTPPCAKLLINKHIPRVVIATADPFSAVSGRGIAMLNDAGIQTSVGLYSAVSQQLNAVFMTAHTHRRPFVTLKWAQSADGFMDASRSAGSRPARFSTPLSATLVHRLRSLHGAILVGSGTVMADNPRLDTRLFPGNQPTPVILDRRRRIGPDFTVAQNDRTLIFSNFDSIEDVLRNLYDKGITSVLVEGGATVLNAFIAEGLWDAARCESAPFRLGDRGAAKAPALPAAPIAKFNIGANSVAWFSNNPLFTASHPFIEVEKP